MGKRNSTVLFNSIAKIYGLFYEIQKRRFNQVIEIVKKELDIKQFKTVLDVGCGTGALCSVMNNMGISVTGVDPAEKMLNIAKDKPENKEIVFTQANILEGLPFEDKSFDASIASYVAHGMGKEERKLMYAEMKRVTRSKVIIYDYNENRSLVTTIIEWLEGGDYFNFIKHAESEMRECFSDVKAVHVDVRVTWYICEAED
ncbi:MAG: class I SAM-dependent methyltransferase [Sedimentibacter sp.]|uniref:class I SAM-dependent methyltransferase n=1 Tax=Sedimentibacter sp. TaxID=1960295 RepID=UPI0031589578